MKKYIFLASALAAFAACTDWTDHYDATTGDGAMAGKSLYEQIASREDLSDFKAVLDSTHVYANNRLTTLHYSDVLDGSQFYTVWAPQNGTFNRDSLLQLCATHDGDSLVGLHFVGNHIARYRHSAGGNETVMMNNGKTKHMNGFYMGGAPLKASNLPAANGILHVMETDYQYHYNIYECLVSLDKYKHLGSFLRSYQIDEFDPNQSLEQGIIDGKTVYADSVFITHNDVLGWQYLDAKIDSEDSTYIMFVPTARLWETIYPRAASFYNYGAIEKADSIHNFYSHYSLMQDLVFNPLWQTSINDSIISTSGSRYTYPYHIYYKPFQPGGLKSFVSDSTVCSNGVIYEIDQWPYEEDMLYFTKIHKECEGTIYDSKETDTKALKINRIYSVPGDSVSGGYLDVSPQTASDAYYVEFEVTGVLSGEYDINIIYLPKTVADPTLDPNSSKTTVKQQFRPCKFTAELTYAGSDGQLYSVTGRKTYTIDPESPSYYVEDKAGSYVMECAEKFPSGNTRSFVSNPYRVDTVRVATAFHFPACNYGQTRCTTRLKIINAVTSKENTPTGYSANMLIDKILLIPHKDETH